MTLIVLHQCYNKILMMNYKTNDYHHTHVKLHKVTGDIVMATSQVRMADFSGCLHSLDWTTGLEYWTEFFTFFGQVSVFILITFQI